jgi:hypothetical protein
MLTDLFWLGDAQPLQLFDHRLPVTVLPHVGEQVLPAPSPELVLSRSGRQVSSLLPWRLAVCTVALQAQVGQEGIGEAHPRPGCHGGPGGTVRVWAQPSQRRTGCEERLHRPACFVRPTAPGGGECRGLGHESKHLPGRPVTRADAVQRAEVADRQPPGIHTAGTDGPRGLREDERCATPPPQGPAVAAGVELPARRAEAPMARARGGHVAPLRATGLHDRPTHIGGLTPDHDRDAGGRWPRPEQVGGHRGRLAEGPPHGGTGLLRDSEAEALGDHVRAEDQQATPRLGAPEGRVEPRVLPLGPGVQRLAPCGLLRLIDAAIARRSRLGVHGLQELPGRLTEGRRGVPPRHEADVVDAGLVVCGISRRVEVCDVPSAPREGHGQHQEAQRVAMVPMPWGLQAEKKRVKGGRHPYDSQPGGHAPQPRVSGRDIPSCAVGRAWPPLPRLVKPQLRPRLKKSVNLSKNNRL